MEHTFKIGDACLDCQQLGRSAKLREFFINHTETIIKCESNSCIFPYVDDFSSHEDTSATLEPIEAKEHQSVTSDPRMVDAAPGSSLNVTPFASAAILTSVNVQSHNGIEQQSPEEKKDELNSTKELTPSKIPQALTNDSALNDIECGFDLLSMENEIDSWTDLLHEALEKEMIFQIASMPEKQNNAVENSFSAFSNTQHFPAGVQASSKTATKSKVFIISDEIITKPTTVKLNMTKKSPTKTSAKEQQQIDTKIACNTQRKNKNQAVPPDSLKAMALSSQKSALQQQFSSAINSDDEDDFPNSLSPHKRKTKQPGFGQSKLVKKAFATIPQPQVAEKETQNPPVNSSPSSQLLGTARNTEEAQVMAVASKSPQFSEEVQTMPAVSAINSEETQKTAPIGKLKHKKPEKESVLLTPQRLKTEIKTNLNMEQTAITPTAINLQQTELIPTVENVEQFGITTETVIESEKIQSPLNPQQYGTATETTLNTHKAHFSPIPINSQQFEPNTATATNSPQHMTTAISSEPFGTTSPKMSIVINASHLDELTTSLKTALSLQNRKILPNTINLKLYTVGTTAGSHSTQSEIQTAVNTPQIQLLSESPRKGTDTLKWPPRTPKRLRKTPVARKVASDSQTRTAETTPKVIAMSIVDFASTSQPSMGGVFLKADLPKKTTERTKNKKDTPNEIAPNTNSSITDVMNVLNLKSN